MVTEQPHRLPGRKVSTGLRMVCTQAVSTGVHTISTSGSVCLCRFLAVHRQYPADSMYDQALRLIVHADQDRAAIFEVVENDGKQYLRVKAQRASSAPGVVGAYLTVPDNSERDQYSNYLAVTADFDKAMPVTVEPA